MTSSDTVAPRLPWDAAHPYPFYERRRRSGDVTWDDTAQAWLVVGYDAARQVLGTPGWTSDPLANAGNRAAMDPIGQHFTGNSMLFADGSTHQRLRGSVRDVFTPSFLTNLATGVESIAAAVTDQPVTGTPFDLMSEIALPLPLAVIAEWLNLDAATCRALREQSSHIIRMLGSLADVGEMGRGAGASAVLIAQLLPLAADRRARPADDLLSFIAADPALDLDDVVMTTLLLAVAGHETTANLIGASVVRILTPRADGTRLVDEIDPADPATITELLRLDAPVQSTVRTATRDHLVGGVEIPAGHSALVAVAAANRDPRAFDDPDTFRTDRTGPAPLSFGYGAHYCIGASLARLEITAALPRILNRHPALAAPVTWRDTPAIRGPLTVPVVFSSP